MFCGFVLDDYVFVFWFDDVDCYSFYMVFVLFDIDVFWFVGDEVMKKKWLLVWMGIGFGMVDIVVEFFVGVVDGVEFGDLVEIVE